MLYSSLVKKRATHPTHSKEGGRRRRRQEGRESTQRATCKQKKTNSKTENGKQMAQKNTKCESKRCKKTRTRDPKISTSVRVNSSTAWTSKLISSYKFMLMHMHYMYMYK